MVKITNGTDIFEVTDGAYESIYRHQGFQVMREKEHNPFEHDNSEKKTADEMFIEELTEKPVSQWNKDEVKHYAAISGIDIKGTKSVNEAKELIKKEMNIG